MDLPSPHDTISAIATPVGEGGIGIIKISGREATTVAKRLFQPSTASFPLPSHRLHHGWIRIPETGQLVDEVLLAFMAAPKSYTREDVVEIHCHSGYAVLQKILELVLQSGTRLAEPGEFTYRAFLNGRIDLSQAEAVADLIHSRSEQSLLLAGRNLKGALSRQVQEWREKVLECQAEVEAALDFSEDLEEHGYSPETVAENIRRDLLDPIEAALAGYEECRILREGFTMVLVGKPNVGKSSLLNALLMRDRAIVTALPGTTRDVIEDTFLLSGVLVRVLDTAGIRGEPDLIESMGIERAVAAIDDADLALWLLDSSLPLTREDEAVFSAVSRKRHIILVNKADLPQRFSLEELRERFPSDAPAIRLSVLDPQDILRLRRFLVETVLQEPLRTAQSMLAVNARHRECLVDARQALDRAVQRLLEGDSGELTSLELGSARRRLESILGWEKEGDVLDLIFSRFCIGK